MNRVTRIGVALSYLSLAAVPLYGANEGVQVHDPGISKPAVGDTSRVESFRSQRRRKCSSAEPEASGTPLSPRCLARENR